MRMNRVLGGLCIGIVGLLCIFNILDLVEKAIHYGLEAIAFASKHLGISSSAAPPVAISKFVEGALQKDNFFLTAFYWANRVLLFFGFVVAFGVLIAKKDALLPAKYWCYATLLISALYVFCVIVAPMSYSFELPWMAGYLSQRIKGLLELAVQLIFVGIAAYFIDRELNESR
jgi:TRAP-type uncharacterized transport system fused permease subunit